MDYQRDEHRMHLIIYHLVWCPKRRKPVLVGQVAEDCRYWLEATCRVQGWEVIELAIQPDHVHLFVRVCPGHSAAEVIKRCKGITSFQLRKAHPQLRKLPSLWTRSYFAGTAGNVSSDAIKRYIEAQKGL